MPSCDITCLHNFGSDIEADQPTLRCITQHPLLQKISLQREVIETAFVGLCQVRGTSQSAPPGTDLTLAKFEQISLFNTN